MQNPTADLDAARSFVIGRIEDEAARSGEPLDDEQRSLLHHLPTTPAPLIVSGLESPEFMPRDFEYEKLCALAKAAYTVDRAHPESALRWKFALAVSKLNRDPLAWLLHWAGVRERRPWRDRWLLAGAGLLLTVGWMLVMFFGEYLGESWTPMKWLVVGGGCAGVFALLYFCSRRSEERLWKQTVEKYRKELLSSDGNAG